MRRRLVLFVVILAAATLPATAAAGLIALKIDFRAAAGAKARILTLRCSEKPTGTVPRPLVACSRLQQLGDDVFRPVPPGTACTAISGGPSTARVSGIYFGRPLWVRLRRDNGCEIERWQRVAFLLPRPSSP